MRVQCQNCRSIYELDEARFANVPEVKCSQCGAIIVLRAPEPEPEESPATIPLAVPGVGVQVGGAPPSAGQVKCIECGEIQPAGATCRNCFFPLPEK